MASQVFTVRELVAYIQVSLENDQLLRDVWLSGEVADYSRSAAGHSYFTLRDGDVSFRCVLFNLRPGAEHLAIGAQVNLHGRVAVYQARGEVQFNADKVLAAGQGEEAAKLQLLMAKLEHEGLFDSARKRQLPALPKRIGVVTSEQGAAFQDIVKTLSRRYGLAEVLLSPTLVQGDSAPDEIVRAIRRLNEIGNIDVLIVGRGGGSAEDLAAFNSEVVARAVYASAIPVVSAVGHEADTTVIDFVADLRAATPTAAAEMVAPDRAALIQESNSLVRHAAGLVKQFVTEQAGQLAETVNRLEWRIPDFDGRRQGVDDAMSQVTNRIERTLRQHKAGVQSNEASLVALNPVGVLSRGYATLSRQSGDVIASVQGVQRGDLFRATLSDGSFDAVAGGTDEQSKPSRLQRANRQRSDSDGRQPSLL